MATAGPPKKPLVAIMGTTGSGKSDLAVDLAAKFNGEIINADAMQMYRGLPVITNQLSIEEQRGVPHHLLAMIDPREPAWSVDSFAREASKLIREIRSRGKLPIVVGGTHYYIHALLFENHLVGSREIDDGSLEHCPPGQVTSQFPILDGATDVMLKRLREVDPDMADRWHPDDRRKIKRSLEIFLTTGRRASDIYAEQRRAKAMSDPEKDHWQSLMFWVYTEPEVLKERLNKRVDKMAQNGLMREVRDLHETRRVRAEQGEDVDLTRGVWQSIGYKQMVPFLTAEPSGTTLDDLEKLKETGLEEMRIATRQYAKYQLRWIKHKSIPALKDHGVMDYLFLLDSSNVDSFSADVLQRPAELCRGFLDGQPLVRPTEISRTAREVLTTFENQATSSKAPFKVKTCEACNMSLQTEEQWEKHIKGRKHRRTIQKRKKTALVPFDPENQCSRGCGNSAATPEITTLPLNNSSA
ncbi:tRNA isopentenyltransferase [Xylariaceae sp. FL0662B]|nr:tRNA isopentenyltransferase [Xylariaceae sp. FL0662B]